MSLSLFDKVEISWSDWFPSRVGQIGEVVAFSPSTSLVKVNFADGSSRWFAEGQLKKVVKELQDGK